MIANPDLKAYRYDPYSKVFTLESYDHHLMKTNRMKEVNRSMLSSNKSWGVILGTLGRQGNPKVLDFLTKKLRDNGKTVFTILLSEIFPQKLKMMSSSVEAWVQIACPRLSIDWGMAFDKVNIYVQKLCCSILEFSLFNFLRITPIRAIFSEYFIQP